MNRGFRIWLLFVVVSSMLSMATKLQAEQRTQPPLFQGRTLQYWVRQAAAGAMGAEAVPVLMETFENSTGGPRIRAACVLGSIGEDAKPAIPVIQRIMKEESPVVQERLRGVLEQIDPERFAAHSAAGQATDLEANHGMSVKVPRSGWPQFHGPARDSICRDKGLLQSWPEGGPKLLWASADDRMSPLHRNPTIIS